jgi:hypothetical protein
MKSVELIEKYCCNGCARAKIHCSDIEVNKKEGYRVCKNHLPAGLLSGFSFVMNYALPPGFNETLQSTQIRIWEPGSRPSYNALSVAVWALEDDGLLFVRVLWPRTGWYYVDIVPEATIAEVCPSALDVRPILHLLAEK